MQQIEPHVYNNNNNIIMANVNRGLHKCTPKWDLYTMSCIHVYLATGLTLFLVASPTDGTAFLLDSEEFKAAFLEPGTFIMPSFAESAVVDCLDWMLVALSV